MLNKVMIIGHVGQDPVVKSNNAGKEFATLSVATTEKWKDKTTGEKKEKTEWHRIVVFNEHLVTFIKQYVKKGSKVWVEGQLATREWDDKDGIKRYYTEVNIKHKGSVQLLDSKESFKENQPPDNAYDE